MGVKRKDNIYNEFIENYIESDKYGVVLFNGRWGSGKTHFLNTIEGLLEKKTKMIFLDYWDEEIDYNKYTLLYRKLYPMKFQLIKYFLAITFFILAIILSMMNYIGFSFLQTNAKYIIILTLLFSFSSVFISNYKEFDKEVFFKNKITKKFKKQKKYSINNKKTILVIDDFDRIDFNEQRQLYSLINIFKEYNVLIILVGNILEIEEDLRENFIYKIVDERYDLDNFIKSSELLNEFEIQIINRYGLNYYSREITSIRRDFINTKKTYRDYIQYMNLTSDFYEKNKIREYINGEEMLYLLYLYLFYYEIYNNIISIYSYEGNFIRELHPSEARKNKLEEIEISKKLDGLLNPFMNNDQSKSFPSIYNGYLDAYLVGNSKNFNNLKLSIDLSKELNLKNILEASHKLDQESKGIFRSRMYLKMREIKHSDESDLNLILNEFLHYLLNNNILFNNNIEHDADFLKALIYDFKNIMTAEIIKDGVFLDILKEQRGSISEISYLIRLIDQDLILNDENIKKYLYIYLRDFNLEKEDSGYFSLKLLFLLQKDHIQFKETLKKVTEYDDKEFIETTLEKLCSHEIYNNEKKNIYLMEFIYYYDDISGLFHKRITNIKDELIKNKMIAYYEKGLSKKSFILIGDDRI